jgi:hypothetical protein
MKRLDGKKILFLGPRFFGYEKEIINEMEGRGAEVDWLPDRPFDTTMMTAITRMCPGLVIPFADRLYESLLMKWGSSHYDFILVINGQTLSSKLLKVLRGSFPHAKLILYMWDSIENRPGIIKDLHNFDAAFSFDPASVRNYGMQLRPLFFGKGFQEQGRDKSYYDLSFIGTIHSDRYSVINTLRKNLPPKLNTYWYLYLKAPWVYHAFRMGKPGMRSATKKEFNFIPLSKNVVQSIFACSKAIIDVEHPKQRGLTMRTLETFGSHKKLVTTNSHILSYDFYNSANIFVIDRKSPVITSDFLEAPYIKPSQELYRRYTIEGWLDEICGL